MHMKPPIGATLDMSHPLARGLVGAWLFNEGGGTILHDIVGNTQLTRAASASWASDGSLFNNAQNGLSSLATTSGGGFTIAGSVRINNKNIYHDDGICGRENSIDGDGYQVWLDQFGGTKRWGIHVNNTTAVYSTSLLEYGCWYSFALSAGPMGWQIYVNGEAIITSGIAQDVNAITPHRFFSTINATAKASTANHGHYFLHDGALAESALKELSLDPYQAFRPKKRTYYIPSGTPVYRYLGPYGTLSYYRIN